MDWKRTGKITLRSGDYLIIRYPTHYAAFHGLQEARGAIGRYACSEDAKAACEAHNAAIEQKNPQAA